MSDTVLDPGLHKARVQFLANTTITGSVRAEIAASWRRSVGHGLAPDQFFAPYDPDLDFSGRFADAAKPVADQLSADLADTGVTLLLGDADARLLSRHVTDLSQRARLDKDQVAPGFQHSEELIGTNGIGTALRRGRPIAVRGEEHFADVLAPLACTAAPVKDPSTGEAIGAVCLTCTADLAHPLMLPIIKRAGREIEERLLAMTSTGNPALRDSFMRARQRNGGALVAVGQQALQTNSPAARIVRPADQPMLWDWVAAVIAGVRSADADLELSSGAVVAARAWPVFDGGVLAGALVAMDPQARAQPSVAGGVPIMGWASLTKTERNVAEIIAEGVTNREAAAQLFLSPHTIDYHLRQIFRKLGISSRVELARHVLAQSDPRITARLTVASRAAMPDSRAA
jgi:transcriptional regulator of acetoin/glycerol metabolism/DNA-binding CsgD family transcriptional regulator